MAQQAGATAATTLGSAPVETLDIFVAACADLQVDSMIDMLGVDDPLQVLMKLKTPPDVVILHRGRDEESTRGKVIQYRHVNRLRSKYDVVISAAGGVDLKEARSAIFNGANIVVVNLVRPRRPVGGHLHRQRRGGDGEDVFGYDRVALRHQVQGTLEVPCT